MYVFLLILRLREAITQAAEALNTPSRTLEVTNRFPPLFASLCVANIIPYAFHDLENKHYDPK